MQLASVYPLLYKVLRPTFPGCLWSGRSDIKAIALTIDDGPHPAHTLPLLEVLDYYQIQASFFWLEFVCSDFQKLLEPFGSEVTGLDSMAMITALFRNFRQWHYDRA